MNREQQLRYLENLYGQVEEGKATITNQSSHTVRDEKTYKKKLTIDSITVSITN